MNFDTHRAGLLLHPTSLPSGTLADADRWLDFLQAAGFGVWQMLPLGVPLAGLSPYQCASAFAVNPALFPATHVDMRALSAGATNSVTGSTTMRASWRSGGSRAMRPG